MCGFYGTLTDKRVTKAKAAADAFETRQRASLAAKGLLTPDDMKRQLAATYAKQRADLIERERPDIGLSEPPNPEWRRHGVLWMSGYARTKQYHTDIYPTL